MNIHESTGESVFERGARLKYEETTQHVSLLNKCI